MTTSQVVGILKRLQEIFIADCRFLKDLYCLDGVSTPRLLRLPHKKLVERERDCKGLFIADDGIIILRLLFGVTYIRLIVHGCGIHYR